MMMNYDHVLDRIKVFAHDFFRDHRNEKYVYHDPHHTKDVVEAVKTITAFYGIKGEDHFIVVAAAWFHDLGYFIDPLHHEEKGAELAAQFLAGENAGQELIDKVRGCIMATKLPQQPRNQLEQIICDADLFHFGTDDFNKKNKLLLEEYNNLHEEQMSKSVWRDKTVAMMEAHHFFTDYGLLYLVRTKERNLHELKHKHYHDEEQNTTNMAHKHKSHHDDDHEIDDHENDNHETDSRETDDHEIDGHKKKEKKDTKQSPEKGAETMFRISSNNQSRLSHLADNKAHILITVNSIILSAVISLVLRKLTNNEYLVIPSFILLFVSVATIVFAILATRPTLPKGTFTIEQVAEKQVNLLFFGNFYKMGLESYRTAMQEIVRDRDLVFDNLIRDIYSQGIVLGRKYRLLHIAYSVFMYGLIVSVIAFVIAAAAPHSAAGPMPALDSIKALSHHIK